MWALAEDERSTGASVFSDVLPPDVLEHLERDVALFIDAFDGGYEPPTRPGSLTSGASARRAPRSQQPTTRLLLSHTFVRLN